MIGSFATLMDLVVAGDDVFVGPPSPDQGGRTFGGQFLAHSLGAAQQTVPDDRAVHSTHSYFIKAGDAAKPTELRVDRLRDGRSFSQRQVVAVQNDVELFRSLISFHVPENGLEWQERITIGASPPTGEQPYTDYNDFIDEILPVDERPWSGRDRPVDVRYINAPQEADQPATGPQQMWLRVHGPLGANRSLHDGALAYLADTRMGAAILLTHGYSWRDGRATHASLDHAMWFHRPAKVDEWLYFDQRVESTSGGRGLANARFYDTDGHLVATCLQEGLMRWTG